MRFKTAEICKSFLDAFNRAKDESPEPGSTPEKKKPTESVPSFATLAASGEKAPFAALGGAPKSSPVKESGAREEGADNYEPDVQFTPLVSLEKVETTSGTEDEETKFIHRCKLYR